MSITVRYFASLRERVGRAEDQLEPGNNDTAGGVWSRAVPDQTMPDRVLIAINQEYADADHPVSDGDEVAFFPPVTGG
ncbi:MAG: molybdopterin converting factor subunit 1 [Thioalkalivibrio sp.]